MSLEQVPIDALKWGACGLFSLAIICAVYGIACDRQSLPHRWWALYVTYLERSLRSMFIMTPGRYIAAGQIVALALGIGLALSLRDPRFYLAVPARRDRPGCSTSSSSNGGGSS